MNRSEFVRNLGAVATGLVLSKITTTAAEPSATTPPAPPAPGDEALRKELAGAKYENEFINNWLTDLFDTMDAELDRAKQVKLIEGCGRGCFRRHEFKRAIAREGTGDLDKLLAAYRKNFEVWREADDVHIRYGEVSPGCYCPAAKHRAMKPNDVHCECTRMTHQTIFETALGRPFKAEVLESVRRGGKTCHLVVHLGTTAGAAAGAAG